MAGSDKPSSSLAARIAAAVQRQQDDADTQRTARVERRDRIQAEQESLFAELAQLGADAGLGVALRDGVLTWTLGARSVSFERRATPEQPSWIHIEATGVDGEIGAWFEFRLERWALKIVRPSKLGRRDVVRSVTLTGEGLDWLVSRGLDLELD